MLQEMPKRKSNRLSGFDYSQAGYYFVTVCTEKRIPLLRKNTQYTPKDANFPPLTEIGKIAEAALLDIQNHYRCVEVDHYVVMPNHIHAILIFTEDKRAVRVPTLSRVMHGWKEAVTKQIGKSIWQKGFYDHVVRDEQDYLRIWQYIEDNPAKWTEDKYYAKP